MRHRTLPVISVQYHPEAAPGPHDAEHHFQRFVELMEKRFSELRTRNALFLDRHLQFTSREVRPDAHHLLGCGFGVQFFLHCFSS